LEERKRFAEIDDHLMGWPIKASDKDAQANPGRRAGFHIDNFITQNHATSGIKRKVLHSFQYHSGLGLHHR